MKEDKVVEKEEKVEEVSKPKEVKADTVDFQKELDELRAFKAKVEEEKKIQAEARKLVEQQKREAVNVSDSFFGKGENRTAPESKSNVDKY